jgi:ubiquinone/menaquinone biosynthesis C-methylase UbiE
MNIFKRFINNCAKPENNCFGKTILVGMNIGHGKMSKWGFSQFYLNHEKKVLDIGCGGGKNIKRFLHVLPDAKVWGLDCSSESVRKSTKLNARAIAEGRTEITEGDVIDMPYADESFDAISAFETIYFWQPIQKGFKEVKRVLKTGGRFFIICELNDSGKGHFWSDQITGMKTYSIEQLKTLLQESGFKVSGTNTKGSFLFIEATKVA